MIAHVFLGGKAETFAVQGRLPSSRDRATSVNGNAREPAGAVELGRRRRREARPKSVRRSPPVAALRHLRRDGFDSLGKFAPFCGGPTHGSMRGYAFITLASLTHPGESHRH
ncbi:hypothetical protein BHE74_00059075 [Ensete ventricosum]|nr:hypothetical protein BHE74_00059075 [Ensete ventricosum]RZS07629.1 hypothetical protein BHM03_00038495 [Ensete ventricosum]